MERGCWVQIARLPTVPDQLGEDEQASEREETQNDDCGALYPFKVGQKSLPEDCDDDQGGKTDTGN